MKNMRKLFYLITACFVLICISCKDKHEECDDFKLDRGVNISHWLSQSNVRGKARADYFTEKDVAYIARCFLKMEKKIPRHSLYCMMH